MSRLLAATVAVFASFVAVAIAEQATIDLSGKWTVTWLDNGSRNKMTLTQTADRLSGQYTNDSNDVCSVSGTLNVEGRSLRLQITCPKWDIKMDGHYSADGKTVVGSYLAYGSSAGGFQMSRE